MNATPYSDRDMSLAEATAWLDNADISPDVKSYAMLVVAQDLVASGRASPFIGTSRIAALLLLNSEPSRNGLVPDPQPIAIRYQSAAGPVRSATILPLRVYWGPIVHWPGPDWIVTAIDCDYLERQDYRLAAILDPEAVPC